MRREHGTGSSTGFTLTKLCVHWLKVGRRLIRLADSWRLAEEAAGVGGDSASPGGGGGPGSLVEEVEEICKQYGVLRELRES